MTLLLTEDQEAIRDAVVRACGPFDDDYWRQHDESAEFPEEFYHAMADGGWLGIAMPEAFGGSGLGVTEAAILMHTVAHERGAMSAASAIHMNIFGPQAVVAFGTDEQKRRFLPDLIQGRKKACFGVTEPDSGLDTASLRTRAERSGNGWVVHGKKVWTSTAQLADKILLIARTTPKEECQRPSDGLSLFFTDLDRKYCDVRRIPKMGRAAVDSNEVFIDGLPIPADDLIGEAGKGFRYLLHSLNAERILVAAEAVAIGQQAVQRAARYARERIVFDRPIGMNQGIQHPLAECWMELEAAHLMTMHAAALYDSGKDCAAYANAAKYLGAEAGFKACSTAIMTHGGMGYAKEFHVERLLREVLIARIAPVSPQMILNYVAERVLDLPRSY